jgi:hypothetical protein
LHGRSSRSGPGGAPGRPAFCRGRQAANEGGYGMRLALGRPGSVIGLAGAAGVEGQVAVGAGSGRPLATSCLLTRVGGRTSRRLLKKPPRRLLKKPPCQRASVTEWEVQGGGLVAEERGLAMLPSGLCCDISRE